MTSKLKKLAFFVGFALLATGASGGLSAALFASDKTDAIEPIAGVKVTHTGAATYRIIWPETDGAVTLYASHDPDQKGDLIAAGLEGGTYTYKAEDHHRHYFTLESETGGVKKAAARLLPLEGGRNFRDLGGYETADGRHVKWGRVFRSGTMGFLTSGDYDYLSSIGIKTICDYRTQEERAVEPTLWQAGGTTYKVFDEKPDGTNSDGFEKLFSSPDVNPAMVKGVMTGFYHRIAYDHAHKYKDMFQELVAGKTPLAFNCSAGKDRAGTSAALLLTALGVPEETVVKDYALSEKLVDYAKEYEKKSKDDDDENPYAFLRALPADLVAPLMRSDPDYIRATFKTLTENHGSVLNFIQSELDVSDDDLAKIRADLLE